MLTKGLFLSLFVMFFCINPRLLEDDTYKRQSKELLERWLNPKPHIAEGICTHVDTTTVELQIVRIVTVPRISTWWPILTGGANTAYNINDVATQGRQIEIITCISYGRRPRIEDATINIVVNFPRRTHVCCVICGLLGVVMILCLQYRFLLKPHATFI